VRFRLLISILLVSIPMLSAPSASAQARHGDGSSAVLRESVGTTPPARAGEQEPAVPGVRALRIGTEVLGGWAGLLGLGYAGWRVGYAADGEENSFPFRYGAVGGAFAGALLGAPLGVWGAGHAVDGNGHLLWTALGSTAGMAGAWLFTMAGADLESTPVLAALTSLPVAGAIIAFELSSDPSRARAAERDGPDRDAGLHLAPSLVVSSDLAAAGMIGRF